MNYGAMYDIESQLNEKGYTLGNDAETGEKLHFGLNICHIHGIITDGEWDKGIQRLNKWIGKHAKRIESNDE